MNKNEMMFYLEKLPVQFRVLVTSFGKDEYSRHVTTVKVDMRSAYYKAINKATNTVTAYGYSIQNPSDEYDYKRGVRIALGRAAKEILGGAAFGYSPELCEEILANKGLDPIDSSDIKALTSDLFNAFQEQLDKETQEEVEEFISRVKEVAEKKNESQFIMEVSNKIEINGIEVNEDDLESQLLIEMEKAFPGYDVKLVRI